MPVEQIQLWRHLGILYRLKSSKLVALGIVFEGIPIISPKSSYWNNRMKQGEMHKGHGICKQEISSNIKILLIALIKKASQQ